MNQSQPLKGLRKAMTIVEPFQGSEDSMDRIPRVARQPRLRRGARLTLGYDV